MYGHYTPTGAGRPISARKCTDLSVNARLFPCYTPAMPRTLDTPPEPKRPARRKSERVEIRLDDELAQAAKEKAEAHGWSLSSVIRALLGLWAEEDVISPDDVGRHMKRAPRKKKRAGD